MRLMRFLDNKDKKIKYCTVENGSNFLIDGDIYSNYKVTKEKANISKWKAYKIKHFWKQMPQNL